MALTKQLLSEKCRFFLPILLPLSSKSVFFYNGSAISQKLTLITYNRKKQESTQSPLGTANRTIKD